jgi:hypothetical protein
VWRRIEYTLRGGDNVDDNDSDALADSESDAVASTHHLIEPAGSFGLFVGLYRDRIYIDVQRERGRLFRHVVGYEFGL